MDLNKQQIKSIEKILNKFDIKFAFLYGSRAKGTSIKTSDYDIAVFIDPKNSYDERLKKRLKLISLLAPILENKAQVIVLNDTKSVLLKFVVVKEGICFYETDHAARVYFELRAMQDYYDFKPFIEKYNQAYLERNLKENYASIN